MEKRRNPVLTALRIIGIVILVIVALFDRQSDDAFCDLADFLCLCLSGNDLSMIQESCNLAAKKCFSLVCCSAEFSVT